MKKLQLFKENNEILGSDGIMYVDGRLAIRNIKKEVQERNKRMVNFPHVIADSFAIYLTRSFYGKQYEI